ncbi:prepilin-type N-terminal cleavage/methylation domain protein [[Clostridium] bifermentans ATCC 19299]|uniref:pilus assembly FimT family protein n=1 Tax=Paraclostridium bifermentans TaxID=1490 RepID=UPI00038D306C|nr:prepilin-type N-terminal cleavage/methylation domain-containing protein [Paraclostridium bifermentans]EQK44975.1 prepilin-type N-terminal cleavage/methylation domain protein [[Clostridium] bifermentans ATCC 19299] [Paraclostridium bifermentans ATCC 19299]MDO7203969.1 prepilin-type N-terminal cleavage/methylation domain-containing protein [Paraclostridium bifermentans]GIM31461.1 type IV pilin [Paraclostridium bifermentans subsp. muricolitidis]
MKIDKKIIMKKRRGFTLIELVIVVAILGVLSSIALVKFGDVEKNSKINADYVTANNIATAAKLAINSDVSEDEISIDYLVKNNYLEGKPKVQSQKDKNFEVYTENEDIKVKVDGQTFYPKNEQE